MGLPRSTSDDAPAAEVDEAAIVARIAAIRDGFEAHGYRRVGAALRHRGIVVNGEEIRRPMRGYDLQPGRRRRFVAATDGDHDGPILPDRAEGVVIDGPNQLWAADLPPTSRSRPASSTSPPSSTPGRVGWSGTRSAARSMPGSRWRRSRPPAAPGNRRRAARAPLRPWLPVRVRGLPGELLAEHGPVGSTGRRGDPYDNAKAERTTPRRRGQRQGGELHEDARGRGGVPDGP
jgi:putative transposase